MAEFGAKAGAGLQAFGALGGGGGMGGRKSRAGALESGVLVLFGVIRWDGSFAGEGVWVAMSVARTEAEGSTL